MIAAVQQAVALEPDARQDSVAQFCAQLVGKRRHLVSGAWPQERRLPYQFDMNCRELRKASRLRMS